MSAAPHEAPGPPAHLVRPVPGVDAAEPLRLPKPAARTLANGLQVTAVRRPGVPLVQLRLVLPTSRPRTTDADRARQRLLGRTLMVGTRRRGQAELAAHLQSLGGGLGAGADAEDLSLSGSALAIAAPDLLEVVREVLEEAAFPAREVATERARAQEELAIARTQPGTIARIHLNRRLHGDHPYGAGLPAPELVGAVRPSHLAGYLRDRVGPQGGHLVLVGDLPTGRALDAAERALGGWAGGRPATPLPPPRSQPTGPLVLVDRPGSVQTSIRMAGPALPRQHPDGPALTLAVTALGGWFASRLTANLREEKGYTYSPGAFVEHQQAASTLLVAADVATEVTAPALVEVHHELGRMASLPVGQDELDAARRYRLGAIAIGLSTQSGLASQLAALAAAGLDLDYLRELPRRFEAVTLEDVLRVARQHLGPARLTTVLVGDAERVAPHLEPLGPLEVVDA